MIFPWPCLNSHMPTCILHTTFKHHIFKTFYLFWQVTLQISLAFRTCWIPPHVPQMSFPDWQSSTYSVTDFTEAFSPPPAVVCYFSIPVNCCHTHLRISLRSLLRYQPSFFLCFIGKTQISSLQFKLYLHSPFPPFGLSYKKKGSYSSPRLILFAMFSAALFFWGGGGEVK